MGIKLDTTLFGGKVHQASLDKLVANKGGKKAATEMLTSQVETLKADYLSKSTFEWSGRIGFWLNTTRLFISQEMTDAFKADETLRTLFAAADKVVAVMDPVGNFDKGTYFKLGNTLKTDKALKEFNTALFGRLKALDSSFKDQTFSVTDKKFPTYAKVYECVLLGAIKKHTDSIKSFILADKEPRKGIKHCAAEVVTRFERKVFTSGVFAEWAAQDIETVNNDTLNEVKANVREMFKDRWNVVLKDEFKGKSSDTFIKEIANPILKELELSQGKTLRNNAKTLNPNATTSRGRKKIKALNKQFKADLKKETSDKLAEASDKKVSLTADLKTGVTALKAEAKVLKKTLKALSELTSKDDKKNLKSVFQKTKLKESETKFKTKTQVDAVKAVLSTLKKPLQDVDVALLSDKAAPLIGTLGESAEKLTSGIEAQAKISKKLKKVTKEKKALKIAKEKANLVTAASVKLADKARKASAFVTELNNVKTASTEPQKPTQERLLEVMNNFAVAFNFNPA